jgi:hypothetical protein
MKSVANSSRASTTTDSTAPQSRARCGSRRGRRCPGRRRRRRRPPRRPCAPSSTGWRRRCRDRRSRRGRCGACSWRVPADGGRAHGSSSGVGGFGRVGCGSGERSGSGQGRGRARGRGGGGGGGVAIRPGGVASGQGSVGRRSPRAPGRRALLGDDQDGVVAGDGGEHVLELGEVDRRGDGVGAGRRGAQDGEVAAGRDVGDEALQGVVEPLAREDGPGSAARR